MFNDQLLVGRRILVTGGGTGLGKSMAARFLQLGAEVHICGRRKIVCDETATELMDLHGGRVVSHGVDIRNAMAVDEMIEAIWTSGPLTDLINNAAGNFISRSEELSPRGFDAVANIVMHGTFYVTHAVGRRWIAAKLPGNVVSITVTWVRNGSPYVVPSAMSKSAIHAMTMSLAVEWGKHGIRLNTIAPGEIPTEGMSKRIKPGDEAGARTRAQNPMGRVGTMEELQNLAVFLISGGCDWINGETIAMDGAQALAMGGNFYQLRDWSDDDWNKARELDQGAERKGPRGAGVMSFLRTQEPITTVANCYKGNQLRCLTDKPRRMGPRVRGDDMLKHRGLHPVLSLLPDDAKLRATKTRRYGRDMSASQQLTNLADMVRDRAKTLGNALAYEFEGRQTTFAEFDVKTNRVANALIALGVKPGERIAYLGKNSDIYFELLMGAMKAKVVMAPVNWRLAGPEVAFIVSDCKAPVLFVGPEFITQVRNIKAQLPDVRTVITTEGGAPEWQDFSAWRDAASGDDPKVPISPKDIAIQLYTSGTTGKPKGAMLSHANFLNLVNAGSEAEKPEWNKWTADDVSLVAMPIFHIGGSGWGVMGLYHGAKGVIAREFDPTRILDFFEQSGITKLFMVPAAMQFVVRQPRARQVDFSRLKYMLYGASPIPAALLKECIEVFKCGFVQLYGMTETTGTIVSPSARGPCRGAGAHALRRQGAARHRACDPRSRRQAVAAPRSRRDRHPLRLQHGRLLEPAGGDRQDARQRRLAAHRRRRLHGRGRLPLYPRSHQGHDHLRRREHLSRRSRERGLRSS